MAFDIDSNGAIATTTWLAPSAGGAEGLVNVKIVVTNVAVLGTLTLRFDWVDPHLGARSNSAGVLALTVLGGFIEYSFYMNNAANNAVTYTATIAGLSGSPTYHIAIGYTQTR